MTHSRVEVGVLQPHLSREEALEWVGVDDEFTAEDVRVLAAPKYLFEYELRLERLFFSDRVMTHSTTVDALNNSAFLNDVYPDVQPESVPDDAVLDTRTDRDDADENSRSVLYHYVKVHFAPFVIVGKQPDISVTREEVAYALYWLVPDGWYESSQPKVTVVDSARGKTLQKKVPLGSVTGESFAAESLA